MSAKFSNKTKIAIMQMRVNPETAALTQKEIAEKLNLCAETVSRVENDENFWDDVFKEVRRMGRKHEAKIWQAFIRNCERGSIQHIKLYLEIMGIYNPRGGNIDVNITAPVIVDDI